MKLCFHRIYSTSLISTFTIFVPFVSYMIRISYSCCILGFDLLAIIPSSFSQVFNLLSISKKSSKIKFLKKFQKNLFKFLCQKRGREAPGRPQGDLPCHLTTRGRSPSLAAPTYGEGGPWPLTYLFIPTSFSLPKNHDTPNSCSCCSPS
jgi:hypothetical protein